MELKEIEFEEIVARIARNLEHLKQYTATPGNGCTRLPFTKETRLAVDYLKKIMTEIGLEVKEDAAGNVFGILAGSEPELPCVMMGSHFDSVINGGDFDGIAGIICAIEVVRQMQDMGIANRRTFVVAGFMDEEGCRYGTGYFGSGAMLGHRDEAYCHQFKDNNGISIAESMKEYGLDPAKITDAAWPEGSIGCFIETHIEQGPVLDTEKIQIGLVDCIVGIQRYMVTVHGRSDHAGTTPMNMRKDPVEAACKCASKIPDWAREKSEGTVATSGYIRSFPGAMNVVAESCEFTIDIRSKVNDDIEDIVAKIRKNLDKNVAKIEGTYDMDTKLIITPCDMSEDMLDIMEESCKKYEYSYKRLPSGAGHDALEIGQVLPTVMLFVPSLNGRSHCPVEFTKYSDFARATRVLRDLVANVVNADTLPCKGKRA